MYDNDLVLLDRSYFRVVQNATGGTIEQSLPQTYLKALFGHSGRNGSPKGQRPLVRELRHNVRLG